ncbi:2362_t:CDS:1, partial [Gigaspora rosea]
KLYLAAHKQLHITILIAAIEITKVTVKDHQLQLITVLAAVQK